MAFTELCNEIFSRAINDYHQADDVDTKVNNPYGEGTIENSLYMKCWIDTVQWHLRTSYVIRTSTLWRPWP